MLPKSGKSPDHCSHSYAGIDTVVVRRPDEGFTATCLLCEIVGPKRSTTEAARRALTDTQARDKDEIFLVATELN